MLIDDRAVGAITIVSAESGHFLGPSDIARVQELARRTSLAIERAQLFAETVSARDAESLSNALLRDSEAKLVLSMEAGGLGSWEWDIRRDIVHWSPQTERMHGLAEGTFTGTREEFSSYIHPDDRERVASEIARTLAERRPTYYIKYRFLRTDGAVRWLEGFARMRADENGEPLSFLGVSHDVTEREELLEGEQQARRDAEAANAAKAIFLTTMSHELRTPLNAVSGYVDLLEMGVRGPVTDLQREDLRRIRRASQHLLSLINDILNYARLEAGRVELHPSEITLVEALSEMEALIAPQLRAKGVAYEYRPCARSVRVLADREKLDQISTQSRRQRGEVHRSRRAHHAELRDRWRECSSDRRGHGTRHPARKARIHFRSRSCRSTVISPPSVSKAWGSAWPSAATSPAPCTATSPCRATRDKVRPSCLHCLSTFPTRRQFADREKSNAFESGDALRSRSVNGARPQRFSMNARIDTVSYCVLSTKPRFANGEMMIVGTREPGPHLSIVGGAT